MKSTTYLLTALSLSVAFAITGCGQSDETTPDFSAINKQKVALGEQLFSNKNLSNNRTMSCATCHALDHAMIDDRDTVMLGASLGDDGHSIGDRNAPTAAYAAFAPSFHFNSGEGLYIGGQFLDGSAKDLKAQAKGPFLNPIEMNMPDASAVIDRVEENASLVTQMKEIYGDSIFDDDTKAYDAVADSIANFEKSSVFSPFDSRYDRLLSSSEMFTQQEIEGLRLFNGKALCSECHPSSTTDGSRPLFTDFSYDNLGVPINVALRTANGVTAIDNGLGKNVNEAKLNGAFKVSSLRNIAVTGPYMHNGLFKDLKTVVHFYNTRDVQGATDLHGNPWEPSEVPATVNHVELGNLHLSDQEEDAIVAFLETLTDKKFEHLIP